MCSSVKYSRMRINYRIANCGWTKKKNEAEISTRAFPLESPSNEHNKNKKLCDSNYRNQSIDQSINQSIHGWFQKISIPYPGRHLGILKESGRGGFLDWNSEDTGGVTQFWIPRGGGGGGHRREGFSSALNFQMGKMAKSLLEIADLLTFLVCNSTKNRLWKQDKDWSGRC